TPEQGHHQGDDARDHERTSCQRRAAYGRAAQDRGEVLEIKRILQLVFAVFAVGFGMLIYAYLTLPDVRPLIKENPATTAFIRLRNEEAVEKGQKPRHVQRWGGDRKICRH